MNSKLLWLTALVPLAVLFAGCGGAVGSDVTAASQSELHDGRNHINVWPTGDPGIDVRSVQSALDQVRPGGSVRLKAHEKLSGVPTAFNFGTGGSVNVSKSVSIIGEVDDAGTPLTRIQGGDKPFSCDDASVVLQISKLRFQEARRAAIYVRQSAAVMLTGNVITNVLPVKAVGYPNPLLIQSPPRQYDPLPYFAASGIEMGLLSCEHPNPAPPNACPDVVHLGSVEISHNFIDVGIYDANGNLLDPNAVYQNSKPDGTPLEDTAFSGIVIVAAELSATISGNTVKNTNRRAIHPLDTFGSTEILENTVVMSPFSSAAPGQTSAGGSGKRSFGIFPLNGNRNIESAIHGAVQTIVRNTVYLATDTGSDGAHGNGIIAVNGVNDTVISENTVIYVSGARNAIVVAGNNSSVSFAKPQYTVIAQNTIDASSHPLDPSSAPAHILVSQANSTTIDSNRYIGALPTYVILGVGTNVVDASHPNTIIDANCGTPRVVFANLASCTQP